MSRLGPIASLSAIAIILVAGCTYLAFGVAKVSWQSENTASMTLPDSGGLVPRSKVLLSGVQVGQVTLVSRGANGVLVDLKLDSHYKIPSAGPIRIENLSALGEPYIEFSPAATGGPYLQNGATIQTSRVELPVSMPDLAQETTTLLQQVNPATINTVVSTFSQAFAGTQAVMPQLARSTQLLAATLLSRTDIIRKMLVDLQAHADDMSWLGPSLNGASGPWSAFGPKVAGLIDSFAKIIAQGNVPDDYTIDKPNEVGLVPLLFQVSQKIDVLGPDLLKLLPVMAPLASSSTSALQHLDISALIEQALNSTSADGALQLQINVK